MSNVAIPSSKAVREIRQPGPYAPTYSPFHQSIATVEPGEKIAVLTADAFSNRITSETQSVAQIVTFPSGNPQTGPITIVGAEPGDTLVVHIHDIEPTRDFAVTALIPYAGALAATRVTATLNAPLPEQVRILPIRDGQIHLTDKIRLPYRPFLGTIGVAPLVEAINSLTPSYYGGNMDAVETCPGHDVLFPVFVKGAHFFTGDAHAAQGDGEITGVACEIPARVTLSFDLIKGRKINWPRVISDTHIMAIGSARPLDDALRIACVELIKWMVEDFGFDQWTAYHLLGQAGEIRVGNMVDPNYSVVAKIQKKYLTP